MQSFLSFTIYILYKSEISILSYEIPPILLVARLIQFYISHEFKSISIFIQLYIIIFLMLAFILVKYFLVDYIIFSYAHLLIHFF